MAPQGNQGGSEVLHALMEGVRKDIDEMYTWRNELERRYRDDKQWANSEHAELRQLVGDLKDVMHEAVDKLKDAMHTMERALYVLIIGSVLLPIVFLVIAHYLWP